MKVTTAAHIPANTAPEAPTTVNRTMRVWLLHFSAEPANGIMHFGAEAADGLAQLGSDGFLAGFEGSQPQGYLLYDAFDAADAVGVGGHGLVSVSHGGGERINRRERGGRRGRTEFFWLGVWSFDRLRMMVGGFAAEGAEFFCGWGWFGREGLAGSVVRWALDSRCGENDGVGGGSLAYAWSKSDLEIPRSLLIWWIVPVARSQLLCLGLIARRPLAGVHPHFAGLATIRGPGRLAPESATQAFQLCAQLPAGHAVTVKVPSERCKEVSSGGMPWPSSLQTWMMVCATAKRLLRVSSGVSPQATQP